MRLPTLCLGLGLAASAALAEAPACYDYGSDRHEAYSQCLIDSGCDHEARYPDIAERSGYVLAEAQKLVCEFVRENPAGQRHSDLTAALEPLMPAPCHRREAEVAINSILYTSILSRQLEASERRWDRDNALITPGPMVDYMRCQR